MPIDDHTKHCLKNECALVVVQILASEIMYVPAIWQYTDSFTCATGYKWPCLKTCDSEICVSEVPVMQGLSVSYFSTKAKNSLFCSLENLFLLL